MRVWNKIKWDYLSTTGALEYLANRRLPTAVKVVYYGIMLPLGLIAYPFAKIWQYIMFKKWGLWDFYKEEKRKLKNQ